MLHTLSFIRHNRDAVYQKDNAWIRTACISVDFLYTRASKTSNIFNQFSIIIFIAPPWHKLIESYECVRDLFQNAPEGLSIAEEEIFIDFMSSGEIKMEFSNKSLFEFCTRVDDEFSALKTKAFHILLPFSISYLCKTWFSAVAALK